MKNLVRKILSHQELLEKPPVLVDIGASGSIHNSWKAISSESIYLAFDPDNREMTTVNRKKNIFKKAYVFDKIVSEKASGSVCFYLTKSPYCSSSLEPDSKSLKEWIFSDLFSITERVDTPAITLGKAISQANINYVDWIKIDTQGTDLRLFKSIPENIRRKILIAEFEPGIIDAYKGEDKLHEVMKDMENTSFWLTDMTVKGTVRISEKYVGRYSRKMRKIISHTHKSSPCWAEITYLNNLSEPDLTKRDCLLSIAFSCIQKQFGFALELCEKGTILFPDECFIKLKYAIQKKITYSGYGNLLKAIVKNIFKKLA